jgi:hypothetical protein
MKLQQMKCQKRDQTNLKEKNCGISTVGNHKKPWDFLG